MKTLLTLAAVAAALVASPAAAQTPVSADRVVVSVADLDLTSRAGLAQLDRRIRTAVQIACGPTSDADPRGKNEVAACRADAIAQARAQRDGALALARQNGPTVLAGR